ncbi:Response regulator receiver domain [Gulbenkiania indica]|uniref:Response regulator receiver domain n=2 Tax=Gulbenkiania indica TaxID=375574 RepID=A0A0K6GT40_9NEIS|nr:Response regulator receiver domain [Gulbenkiania indica]
MSGWSGDGNTGMREEHTLRGASILVVDDDLDILELHKSVLEMEGYAVHTAASGSRALQVLDDIETPDLILLDFRMYDMTGVDFLARLEAEHPQLLDQTPVVFLTGMDSVPPSRAAGFIRKLTDLDRFIELVHEYASRRH